MAKVWVLQHHESETLGTLADALFGSGITWQYVRGFAGQPVPRDLDGADGLVVLGGPMGVDEAGRYPFMADEVRLIERALTKRKPVLGVCLGSQLIAAVLGSAIRKGERLEVGWHRVTLTEAAGADRIWAGVQSPFAAFHWHGDVFDVPTGAVSLAYSDVTPCQAFRYDPDVYGLLFHLEMTMDSIRKLIEAFGRDVDEAGQSGARILQESKTHLDNVERIGHTVFRGWANAFGGES